MPSSTCSSTEWVVSEHQLRHRPWRRHHGRADRAALRQRRHPVAAARPHRRAGARRPREGAQAQAGSAVHARCVPADHRRRLRHAPRSHRRLPTGSSRPSSSASTSSSSCSRGSTQKRKPGSIVSSNTSGIPIAALAEGRSDDFRRHWLGTHFFNPPRYLRLLEIIPDRGDRSGRGGGDHALGDHLLGKGVVVAKDTPNFIANHIGLYGVARTLDVLRTGQIHDRRDRRHHRPRPRTTRQRHLPDDGHCRHRRAGARDAQPERTTAGRGRSRGVRRSSAHRGHAHARVSWREDRQGLLPAAQECRR